VRSVERRRAERRTPAPGEPLSRLRLRTGRELVVLNIASRGALVEGPRLIPGAYLDVHIVTSAARTLVRSRVLRCEVTRVTAEAICYRSGLVFEQPIDVAAGYGIPWQDSQKEAGAGTSYPESDSVALPANPSALTA
jgi:hypothetical protein